MNSFLALIIYGTLLVLIDSLYLKQIAPAFGKMLERIQGKPMRMKLGAAVIVYLSLLGLWYNFIYKDLTRFNFWQNICRAFLMGLFTYAIYDFTNLALIDGYRLDLAVIDSIWGGLLIAGTTALFLKVVSFFKLK